MNINNLRIRCLSLLFILFYWPCMALAGKVTVVPSIGLRGEYNDNVVFESDDEEDDFAAILEPSVSLDYRSERLQLKSMARAAIWRYASEKYLDTENYFFTVGGSCNPHERLETRAHASYIRDTTLESELEETGLVVSRQERDRYRGSWGMTWQLTERTDVGCDFTHAKTEYDRALLDYETNTLSFDINRRMNDSGDVLTIRPYYENYKSDASKVDNYGLSLGWAHQFSETLGLTAFAGVRYTEIEYKLVRVEIAYDPDPHLVFTEVEEKDDNWNWVADISLKKTWETFTIHGGYQQHLRYSSEGDPLDVYKIYAEYEQKITPRLDFSFLASASMTKSEGRFEQEDSKFVSLGTSLDYRLTENHLLRAGYSYNWYRDETVPGGSQTYDRNRVWIAAVFKFPEEW